MPDDKRIWLNTAFGIQFPGGAEAATAGEAEAKGGRGKAGSGSPADATKAAAGAPPKAAAPAQPAAPVSAPLPGDPDIETPMQALRDETAALKKLGFDTTRMAADRADLATTTIAARKLADVDGRKKALEQLKKRAEEELEHAQALSKSLKSVMGASKGKPSAAQKSAIYKQAIEDLYALKITVPAGMSNTHFDRVFDMFGTVPKGDVKQDKLKKLTYSTAEDDQGSGAYAKDEAEIEMGDFGGAAGKEDYEIDGKKIPANSFDVTTLHEIGHSVDAQNGIMSKNQGSTGCGGWQPETMQSVATVFLAEIKKMTLDHAITDDMLKEAVSKALSDGGTGKPASVSEADWRKHAADWKKVVEFLTHKCLPIRRSRKPWFEPQPVVIGDRVYQEAYKDKWWSYAAKERATTKVNDYQWRAPGEWFAEVYAISWLSKKKPPSGVHAVIAGYCWKG